MNWIDYALVVLYLVGMVALGRMFTKNQEGGDYFLGGRKFGWFSLCMSAMATQLSVISFVSAPAFVGLREGGGMKWLTFEFGVPIAMIIVMTIVGPALYKSKVVSIYSFLEKRFNRTTRLLLSVAFMFSRSFATAVTVYAVSIILASLLHLTFTQTILIVGLTTVLYSLEGGMKAVVYSEVIQMIIKVLGIVMIVFYGLHYLGGWDVFVQHVDRSRLTAVDFTNWGFDGKEYGFWPMLFGGVFLYVSYYGTDQIQAQRILSAKDLGTVRKVLLYNGLLRFPITFMYCFGGLVLGTLVMQNDSFRSLIPVVDGVMKTDLMVPVFIEHYLPHGVIGIIVVAIIAAAMSAYSSTLNSLSAVTMEEMIKPNKALTDQQYLYWSKGVASVWGMVTLLLAFYVGDIAKTVIEAINKIGSVFYGPILGVFLLAILTKSAKAKAVNIALILGVSLNVYLWRAQPQIFWFWWNFIGLIFTFTAGWLGSKWVPQSENQPAESVVVLERFEFPVKEGWILFAYFLLILLLSITLPYWLV